MALVKPFVKWVGGKRQLLPEILPRLREMVAPSGTWSGRYFEPFLGGGAVFFALSDDPGFCAVLNDYNAELVSLYRQVQSDPLALADRLEHAEFANTPEAHAAVKAWDRDPNWALRPPLDKAARFVYLNRTSFNGLYRVNQRGHFNAPFGKYKNPGFPSRERLLAASEALSRAEIRQGDFEAAVADARPGDVVYFDPPYIPVSASSSFVGYTHKGFDAGMQERLAALCDQLTERGVAWMVSNADVPLAHDLYGRQPGARVHRVLANRALNCKPDGRGKVGEIVAVCQPALCPSPAPLLDPKVPEIGG